MPSPLSRVLSRRRSSRPPSRTGASVWRDPAFRRLWAGLTASQFGEQAVLVVLPLLAVTTLHAAASDVGLLRAAYQLPVLLSLVVGVVVDRWPGRATLVVADGVRTVVVLAVPLLYAAGRLGLPVLIVTAALLGTCAFLFDTGYQALLVRMVPRERLNAATSAAESSRSATRIGGPALGGALVTWLSAPLAAVAAAVSFGCSAALVRAVPRPAALTPPAARVSALRQAYEGVRLVTTDPSLRAIALASAIFQFANAALVTCYLLFLARTLDLPAAAVGLVLAASGPGALAGAVLAGFLPRRFGFGRVLVVAGIVGGAASLVLPFASGPVVVVVPVLAAAGAIGGVCGQLIDVTVVTMRQAIAPADVQGRVVATFNLLGLGLTPVGSLLGGVLVAAWGTRPVLLATVLAAASCTLVFALSPLARIGRTLPGEVPSGGVPRGTP